MPVEGTLATDLDHDIVITSSDGGRLGLMLAKQEGEQKAWMVAEIPAPTGLRVTEGGVGVQDQPPEMAAAVFRANWIEGMGTRLIGTLNNDYMSGSVQSSVSGKLVKPPHPEEITLPTSEGKVHAMSEFSGAFYISDGRYLHRSTDGISFTQVLDAGASNIVRDLQVYGNSSGTSGMVATVEVEATEAGARYYWTTDGTSFSQADAAGNRELNYLFVKDQTLYGLQNPNTFYVTTNPFTAAATWDTATIVGDEAHNFQGGFVVAGVLVIFKEDRVFTVDADGAVLTLLAQFAEVPSATNFHAHVSGWNSNIYMSVDNEVWEYDPGTGIIRSMELAKLPDTLVVGTSTAHAGLAYDETAIFAMHPTNLDPSGTSLVRIVFDADGIPQIERWCHQSLSGYRPQGPFQFSRLFTTLSTGRHLWVATTTAGKVLRLTIPRAGDPTDDSTSQYSVVDAVYRSGWMNHNFPAQWKDYTELLLDLQGLTPVPPSSRVDVYYYLDNDLTTRITLAENLSANKLHLLEFSNGASARTFLLELVLKSDSNSQTPQVLSWTLKASVKFDFREVITFRCRVVDGAMNRFNIASPHTADEIRTRLRSWRAQRNITLGYQDYRGYNFDNIRILTGFNEQDVTDDEHRLDETVMTVRIMRISEAADALFIVGTDIVGGPKVVGP